MEWQKSKFKRYRYLSGMQWCHVLSAHGRSFYRNQLEKIASMKIDYRKSLELNILFGRLVLIITSMTVLLFLALFFLGDFSKGYSYFFLFFAGIWLFNWLFSTTYLVLGLTKFKDFISPSEKKQAVAFSIVNLLGLIGCGAYLLMN